MLAGATPVLVHNCNLGDYADSVRNESGVKFASEYTSPSGAKYYGRNKHGQQAEGPLADALERTGHHGGCAEVHCLIQAQAAEGPEAIRGGTMRTVRTRNNSMPTSNTDGHGEPAHPCGRCGRLLEDLEINSMDVLFLISSLEAEFGVKVPEKAIRKMVTVGDVVEIIEGLL